MREFLKNRPVFAWALYDWANSAFATTVMAGFFPVFFQKFWSSGRRPTETTSRLGYANATAGASSHCWRPSSARSPIAAGAASSS